MKICSAAALNTEGVASPRGKAWNASTIDGNRTRGHGILINQIYAGTIVWNRVRMVKDRPGRVRRAVERPETGNGVHRVPLRPLIAKELREVLNGRVLWTMLLLLCPLIGYSFFQAMARQIAAATKPKVPGQSS